MNIGIIGTGAYGIALGVNLFKNKNKITMWTKFEYEYDMFNNNRFSPKLPDLVIPSDINITMSLEECLKNEIIIIAIPSSIYKEISLEIKKHMNDYNTFYIVSKGMNDGFLSNIIENIINKEVCVISGPTFADDLLLNKPVGLTVACKNIELVKKIGNCLTNEFINLEDSSDTIGVQICGTIKNAYAIGSGILDGLVASRSTRAAYLKKIINEIEIFLLKIGCDSKTIFSYAGIGDLLLTCNSTKSRNFRYGNLLGKKCSSNEIDEYTKEFLVEGLNSLNEIKKIDNNLPILNMIYDIVFNNQDVEALFNFIK